MKIALFITARLKSSRLPYKVMMDLNGASVIRRVIQRAKAVAGIDRVVVCTSTNPQDFPIVQTALQEGVYSFQGSEEDVLDRLYRAAAFHGVDGFVSITADNPLFSIHHAQRLADLARRTFPDIGEVTNLPLGMGTYFLKTKAVEVACRVKDTPETEFWPVIMRHPTMFDITYLDAQVCPETTYRLTLDTILDYRVINTVYRDVPFKTVLNEYDVISYLEGRPDLVAINSQYQRSWLDQQIVNRIEQYLTDNAERIRAIKDEVYARDH